MNAAHANSVFLAISFLRACILQEAKCRKDADNALDYADIVAGMKGRRLGHGDLL